MADAGMRCSGRPVGSTRASPTRGSGAAVQARSSKPRAAQPAGGGAATDQRAPAPEPAQMDSDGEPEPDEKPSATTNMEIRTSISVAEGNDRRRNAAAHFDELAG